MVNDFATRGWVKLPADPAIKSWADAALPQALHAAKHGVEAHGGFACEGTWFMGLDALANDPFGAVDGVPLRGAVMDFLRDQFGDIPPLHPAQVSIIYPGYPRPRQGDSDAGFRYRLKRDAAHVDGLLLVGEARQRMLREPHGFVLGIPLTDSAPNASPLVVWEGSHLIMKAAFTKALAPYPVEKWAEIDLAEIYQAARRDIFDTCARVELSAKPGEAYVLHRHALHGVAPWIAGQEEGRAVAYFRPEFPEGVERWIKAE